jgi:glycosyltransferase involved in cell wall biosynthesis
MKILWIPHTGWHIPQRAHLFCKALAEKHDVHVTDWVADFASLKDYFSFKYLQNFTYRKYFDGKITVHGIPRISPAIYSAGLRRINTNIFSWYVNKIIEKFEIDVVVGTFVVPPPRAPRLVFDLFDENVLYWRSFGPNPTYADEIEQTEIEYILKADAVVAASSVLADKARILNPQGAVHLISNGVDLRKFDNANGAGIRQKLGLSGKIVGAVGNHDQKYELDKILDAERIFENGDVTFLIAGRGAAVHAAKKRAKQEGAQNVIFTGFIPLTEVAHWISALDVGICSYAKSPMDDARSPMRLLMYLAAGIPVVCTDLEEVRRIGFPNVVLVEDDAESLVMGIQKALNLPKSRSLEIEAFDLNRLVDQYEAVLKG